MKWGWQLATQGESGAPAAGGRAREWASALAGLALTTAAAVLEDWQAADIVWGMWVSSIVTGYAMILLAIGAGVVRGQALLGREDVPVTVARPLALGGGLFLVAFFSVHFLMFHWGHAVFTQLFFPLPGIAGVDDLPRLDGVVQVTLAAYWPVVLASLFARADGFRAALAGNPKEAMTLPYRQVVKNHLMIFIVAGMSALGAQAWLLYVLFAWYFFPFTLLRRHPAA